MLIYNFQKEFLGIDEKDLKFLGFKSLSDLRAEVSDFADLFVKTPGYIHNFKHVHWIDFITCANSHEESKVIINVNNKNYKCFIQISTAYLVDNPSSKAYLINLHKLKELSQKESESISGDIAERVAPTGTTEVKKILNTPDISDDFIQEQDTFEPETSNPSITIDPYETPLEINLDESSQENIIKDEYESSHNIENDDNYLQPLDITFEDDFLVEEETSSSKPEHSLDIEEDLTFTEDIAESNDNDDDFDSDYIYNPSVASDELGLPLDLIEEFIQDFIEQAKEFKPKLYESLEEHDLDNLKILSHKLKGVAANLRIEDALEKLTVINTSNDTSEISSNLVTFYKIIAKLSGEESQNTSPTVAVVEEEIIPEIEPEEIQEITLEFKEDELDDLYSDSITVAEEKEEFQNEEEISVEIKDEININYSKEEIAKEIGLDLTSFNDLFNDYITEANEITTSLKDLIHNNNLTILQTEVHKLKGMSNNIRIECFNDALDTLSSSSDTEALLEALKHIEISLTELSQIGE